MSASLGVRRSSRWQVFQHSLLVVCFTGLVLTGLPQKFSSSQWARGLVLIFSGVERTRFLHHLFGTVMAVQLVWHFGELLWLHLVRRLPMTMLPRLQDVRNFLQQVRYNLGLTFLPPRQDRYTFTEKIEYLVLIWGTVLMVVTGLVLLYPVRWSQVMTGEWIIAAKVAHGGEAISALLSILTWHSYFVHIRHVNRSMFSGYLAEEVYAEEHPLELERLKRGQVPEPAPIQFGRLLLFLFLVSLLVGGSVFLFFLAPLVCARQLGINLYACGKYLQRIGSLGNGPGLGNATSRKGPAFWANDFQEFGGGLWACVSCPGGGEDPREVKPF